MHSPEYRQRLSICRGAPFQLNGCINDALCMRHLLKTRFGFADGDIMLLTDDQANPQFWPTRQNMVYHMQLLVWDLRPGDSLFFHYSGAPPVQPMKFSAFILNAGNLRR